MTTTPTLPDSWKPFAKEETLPSVAGQLDNSTSALVPIGKGTPLPAFRGAEMSEALQAYRDLQKALDAAMPDQIMELDGRPFRKKGYWRAIAVAFNLRLECVSESREEDGAFNDTRPNFGWHVTYRATAPNGRCAMGDGSCFAVEKAKRRGTDPWAALPAQASQHNVRSHAHTRAFNRAVSNLVGFGEVSAEEAEGVEHGAAPDPRALTPDPPEKAIEGPADFYPITAYQCTNGWHEFALVDHQRLERPWKFSTKREQLGGVIAEAYQQGLPIRIDDFTKKKQNGAVEAYVNKLTVYRPDVMKAHPTPDPWPTSEAF